MSTIKVLADKVLAFQNGERDKKGNLVMHKTKIGFSELPDWVAKTPYYKAAILDGSLKPFTNPQSDEKILKAQETLKKLNEEIKAAEEKKEMLATAGEVLAKAKK